MGDADTRPWAGIDLSYSDSVLIVSSLFPQAGEGWNYDVCDRDGNTHMEQSQPSPHPCLPEAARLNCP